MSSLLGDSVLLQDGIEHRQTIKCLMTGLSGESTEHSFTSILSQANNLIKLPEDHPIALLTFCKRITLSIATKILLEIDIRKNIESLSRDFLVFLEGFRTVIKYNLYFTKYGNALKAKRRITKYLKKELNYRRENFIIKRD